MKEMLKFSPFAAVAVFFAVSVSEAQFPQMKVTAWSLRVRTQDGVHVCSLPAGTRIDPVGRTSEGDRIQVKLNQRNCPSTGFVDIRYVRPAQTGARGFEEAKVDENGLSLRSRPYVDGATWQCSLPKDTGVEILPEEHKGSTTTWVRIRLNQARAGCPSEGWVSASYLRPSLSFDQLPVIPEGRGQTEADTCENCPRPRPRPDEMEVARDIERGARTAPAGRSPFLSELMHMRNNRGRCSRSSSYKCHRGLIQMPLIGRNAGFCGTHHYLPDSPTGIDAYASPMTACAFTALAQEWRRTECPRRSGCTIAWGDISHKTRARFNGHVSHTEGNCIDIRPFRSANAGFQDAGLTYRDRGYDRAKTTRFIEMAKKMGATVVIFNDPKIRASRASGHHNHLHVCFGNNQTTRKVCDNLQINPSLCPELQ